MRLMIFAVGKLKDDADRAMCERYAKRLDVLGRGLALGPVEVHELMEARGATADARKADEAQRLLKVSAAADLKIALEVTGKAMTTDALTAFLARERDGGIRSAAFLIGGPDGHGDAVLSEAKLKLSLSPLTLPHGLARIVLVEQLYRAATILAGHPYHRS